jgi:hypothetical protein
MQEGAILHDVELREERHPCTRTTAAEQSAKKRIEGKAARKEWGQGEA